VSYQSELLILWEWKVAPETARRRSELPVRVADIVGVEGGACDGWDAQQRFSHPEKLVPRSIDQEVHVPIILQGQVMIPAVVGLHKAIAVTSVFRRRDNAEGSVVLRHA
jgi:hypothetical protein